MEPNEVEKVINISIEAHNNVAPKTHGTGFSTTYILMALGGMIGVSALSVGMSFALRRCGKLIRLTNF